MTTSGELKVLHKKLVALKKRREMVQQKIEEMRGRLTGVSAPAAKRRALERRPPSDSSKLKR